MIEKLGRGVFATEAIAEGHILESVPTAFLSADQRGIIKSTVVFQYCFVEPDSYKTRGENNAYLVFGLSSLCNHSDQPNASMKWEKRETGMWASLVASRDIAVGDEITLFYTDIDEYPDAEQFV
ncbi:MAG: SET domain-containing protein-lysine N-methyltransferase [candidate division Zixibacteria bacterium]|nr:SET domain-containing protein-lysine N-methyltransferase [candidate division Zixibacteria bacterium]